MSSPTSSTRIASLDALRGFDMCWILGLGAAVSGLLGKFLPDTALTKFITDQLHHVSWDGFHFEDLIFPLFIFLAGVSMAIALPRRVGREGLQSAALHLLQRGLILFVLGIFYNGGIDGGWEKIRILGVLQRIGIASSLAGLLSLRLSTRGIIGVTITILIGYAVLILKTPVPNLAAVNLAIPDANIANYIDAQVLPLRKSNGTWDAEGILSMLPAIANALLGILAGRWLTSGKSPAKIVQGLLATGILSLCLGWVWHPFFPIIKKLWSSSFVLVAAGWSAILLALFYWIIDVRGWSRWSIPFVWIGANPILLYLLSGLSVFQNIAARLVGGTKTPTAWLIPIVAFLLTLLLARWLHKQKIFIRV